jgi:hypothetical protein
MRWDGRYNEWVPFGTHSLYLPFYLISPLLNIYVKLRRHYFRTFSLGLCGCGCSWRNFVYATAVEQEVQQDSSDAACT